MPGIAANADKYVSSNHWSDAHQRASRDVGQCRQCNSHNILHMKTCRQRANGDREEQDP